MKINQIIRKKRKEMSLTQEQVADFFGRIHSGCKQMGKRSFL